ncbi:MAG: ABC transporter permease [Propionibacteriaceae bacterium]|nr:ABC transporter permease [Propionibacteriaceae bacterium]
MDFTPAPRPAPLPRQILTHALTEARLIVRNGEQLLLALVIPVGLLIGARFFGERFGWTLDSAVPSVFGLAVWSSCFTSLAIVTAFERRYGVLERLNSTSLGKVGVLAGKAGAVILICVAQLGVLAGGGLALGWRPGSFSWPVVPAVLLAGLAFAALGLALGGSLRAEATLGLANLVYLLGLAAGILVPSAAYPPAAQAALAWLPTMALGETLRGGGAFGLIVLSAWVVAAGLLARKVFTWTS